MKINILNIPETGLKIQFNMDAGSLSELIADREKFDFEFHEVNVSGLIKRAGHNIFFTGSLETVLEMQCSRCLESVVMPIISNLKYTLLPEEAVEETEIELEAEDLETCYYSGEVIDLVPIIFEQIMLQVPMKILCSEACRGLCPQCGANLNVENCNCRSNFIDERLVVLKNFKIQ